MKEFLFFVGAFALTSTAMASANLAAKADQGPGTRICTNENRSTVAILDLNDVYLVPSAPSQSDEQHNQPAKLPGVATLMIVKFQGEIIDRRLDVQATRKNNATGPSFELEGDSGKVMLLLTSDRRSPDELTISTQLENVTCI